MEANQRTESWKIEPDEGEVSDFSMAEEATSQVIHKENLRCSALERAGSVKRWVDVKG